MELTQTKLAHINRDSTISHDHFFIVINILLAIHFSSLNGYCEMEIMAVESATPHSYNVLA